MVMFDSYQNTETLQIEDILPLGKHAKIQDSNLLILTQCRIVSFILSDTIHIMIHMKRYSICINDIFCLVLDQKKLIYPNISHDFGNFKVEIS